MSSVWDPDGEDWLVDLWRQHWLAAGWTNDKGPAEGWTLSSMPSMLGKGGCRGVNRSTPECPACWNECAAALPLVCGGTLWLKAQASEGPSRACRLLPEVVDRCRAVGSARGGGSCLRPSLLVEPRPPLR